MTRSVAIKMLLCNYRHPRMVSLYPDTALQEHLIECEQYFTAFCLTIKIHVSYASSLL